MIRNHELVFLGMLNYYLHVLSSVVGWDQWLPIHVFGRKGNMVFLLSLLWVFGFFQVFYVEPEAFGFEGFCGSVMFNIDFHSLCAIVAKGDQ